MCHNIPTVEIAEKVVGWDIHRANVDKFERFFLTPKPADQVSAPLIEECFANLECLVADTSMVSKYYFFVVEFIKAWIDSVVKSCGRFIILEAETSWLPVKRSS